MVSHLTRKLSLSMKLSRRADRLEGVRVALRLVDRTNLILNGFHAKVHLWLPLNLAEVGFGRFDVVTGLGAWIIFLGLFFLDELIE